MALSNLSGWNKMAAPACACGAGDKPEEKPAACGSACGAGDKPEEKPAACGSAVWVCQMEKYREYEKFKKCSKCELKAWCRGCPAVASGAHGDFYDTDPQCWKDTSHAEQQA